MPIKLVLLLTIQYGIAIQSVYTQNQLNPILNNKLDSLRMKHGNKGLSASIVFPDNSYWTSSSGLSSSSMDLDTSMILSLGSITKTITSAAILKYAEQNLLKLDDPITKFLDSIKHVNSAITIRQLLRHQSGIYDIVSHPQFNTLLLNDPDSIWSYENALATFLNKANFEPGRAFQYSNSNYVLLGMLIEKISGKKYHEVLEDLFQIDSEYPSFNVRPQNNTGLPYSNVWLDLNGDRIVDDAGDFIYAWNSFSSIAAPAGCIFSNAKDISFWMKKLMSNTLINEVIMNEAKTTVAAGLPNNTTYGLGLMKRKFLTYDAYGHGGDIGYSAFSWYIPDLKISISMLNNDASKTSWTLNPLIEELLRTYIAHSTSVKTLDINESVSIKIFPTLVDNFFTIDIHQNFGSKNLVCKFYTLQGQEIDLSKSLHEGLNKINIPKILQGPFLIQIKDEQKVINQKILFKTN